MSCKVVKLWISEEHPEKNKIITDWIWDACVSISGVVFDGSDMITEFRLNIGNAREEYEAPRCIFDDVVVMDARIPKKQIPDMVQKIAAMMSKKPKDNSRISPIKVGNLTIERTVEKMEGGGSDTMLKMTIRC